MPTSPGARPSNRPTSSAPPASGLRTPSRPDPAEVAPPPALGAPGSLDEVERALSALDGRHADAARALRESQAALAAKRAAVDAAEQNALIHERRMVVVKIAAAVVGIPLLVGGAWYANLRYQRKVAADAALAPMAAPYLSHGWKTFPRPIWKSRHKAEALVGANTCVIALASTSPGTGRFELSRPSGTLTGEGSLAYCTCTDEKIVLRTQAPGGVELLFQEAVAVGGNSALPFVSPRPRSLPVTEACAVDPLDAWLSAGKRGGPPSGDGLGSKLRDAIEGHGWSVVASAPPDLPFAIVPGTANSCFLATSTQGGEALSLRDAGGERVLHPESGAALALGWCTHSARPVTVWHAGAGAVVVFHADATKLGGTMGLREAAVGFGLGDVPTWVTVAERGWDASAPLLLSGVAQADISIPRDDRPVMHSRLVSLTLGSGHVAPVPDEIDRYLCVPSLQSNPASSLCVQSIALGWKAAGGDALGIAESPLPFWMDVMTQVEDHEGLAVEEKLLRLSRRLAAEGYEPTARVGVQEERDGVEVVGRAGDDRIIAVGVLSTPPWVLPYSEGAPWTLDGEPRSIAVKPDEHLHLTTEPPVRVAADVRHTVVFRHKAK